MTKYEKRANELLDRVQSLIDSFEVRKGTSGRAGHHDAQSDIESQYPDILTDVQILLFSDSPEHPLYIQSMKLNERRDYVLSRAGGSFGYSDLIKLRSILSKYIEYRNFLEAGD